MAGKKKDRILFYLATKLAWLLILLLGKTSRITIAGRQHWQKAKDSGAGVLIIMWHGRFLLPAYVFRNQGIIAMVSQHTDGEIIAQTIHRLGWASRRGSSTRGGNKVFHEILTDLKCGRICVIIPDGPQGPRHELKSGAVFLAKRSGAYLLPLTFSASRKIQFNSWDKFTMWLPFSKCVVMFGEPMQVSPYLNAKEMEKLRNTVQQRLIDLEIKADDYF